jgi:hypothetical protein
MPIIRIGAGSALAAATVVLAVSGPALAGGNSAFTDVPLIATTTLDAGTTTAPNGNSIGNSEPAIAFGKDGRMVVDGLSWLSHFGVGAPAQLSTWSGRFGAAPAYFGPLDGNPPPPGNGRTAFGGFDADVTLTPAGTVLFADLVAIVNGGFNNGQLGVSVVRCPAGAGSPADCSSVIVDTASADRPWLTSSGNTVWLAYHDSAESFRVHVQRSTDDGRTWQEVGSPIAGQGAATGDATSDNIAGPIAADPATGALYAVYAAGDAKGVPATFDFNNVYVSTSTDGGKHWAAVRVFHAPSGTALNNVFPSVAVDPLTHVVYTTWTDTHRVWLSASADGGADWSPAEVVPAVATTVMPNVAARGGKVDVVYYGTSAASTNDTSAVWNTYDSQYRGGAWTVKRVSNSPNHVGVVCLNGAACSNDQRELLDLFEVAQDPASGRAAIVYTDTTIDTWTTNGTTEPLPEIVLAFEN